MQELFSTFLGSNLVTSLVTDQVNLVIEIVVRLKLVLEIGSVIIKLVENRA